MSSKGEGSASQRVADVLKSGLERQLVGEEDEDLPANHASHVVSAKFEVDASLDGGQTDVNWDDEKFRKFVDRLSESQDASVL